MNALGVPRPTTDTDVMKVFQLVGLPLEIVHCSRPVWPRGAPTTSSLRRWSRELGVRNRPGPRSRASQPIAPGIGDATLSTPSRCYGSGRAALEDGLDRPSEHDASTPVMPGKAEYGAIARELKSVNEPTGPANGFLAAGLNISASQDVSALMGMRAASTSATRRDAPASHRELLKVTNVSASDSDRARP